MAASANPTAGGNHQEPNNNGHHHHTGGGGGGGGNPSSNGKTTATDNGNNLGVGGVGLAVLKHKTIGLSDKWTPDEQIILDESLIKYASEIPAVRFSRIARLLDDKTARDVALRCRWMTKKESGKRRKDDMSRKSKDKKEKTADPSAKSSAQLAMRPNVPPYTPLMIPMDNDDGMSYKAIGGPTGLLLEQTAQVFDQISANFATLQIHENINLFCQARDNILSLMNDLNDMPGTMRQMPALPVKLRDDLANSILPRPNRPMQL